MTREEYRMKLTCGYCDKEFTRAQAAKHNCTANLKLVIRMDDGIMFWMSDKYLGFGQKRIARRENTE